MAGIRKRLAAPILIGGIGVPILLGLGAWQVQRMAEKQLLIDAVEARMANDPVELPDQVVPERDRLLRVAVKGRLGRREIHVLTSLKPHGPGFRIVTPMEIAPDGHQVTRRIMVDLGYVPERMKSIFDRGGTVRLQKRLFHDKVVGFVYWPDEVDGYTPEPDEERRIWFARDVAAMAEKLETEPVLIVAEIHPDGNVPLPQPPAANLPNKHLEYALTWFGLAAIWAAMSVLWLVTERRKSG